MPISWIGCVLYVDMRSGFGALLSDAAMHYDVVLYKLKIGLDR